MTPGNSPPETVVLRAQDTGGKAVALTRLGPAANGWTYREDGSGDCYRLIPILSGRAGSGERHADDAPIERRNQISADSTRRVASPGSSVAPIVQDFQTRLDHRRFYCVHYGVSARESLHQALREATPTDRISYMARVLEFVQEWWHLLGYGLLPMPADIVIDATGTPCLLPLPFWRFPDVEAVFSEPERGLYLAPEYVRGGGGPQMRYHMDIYALGVILLQCLFRLPSVLDGERVLEAVATLNSLEEMESDLPLWKQELTPVQEMLPVIYRMTSPDVRVRSAFDPDRVAALLRDCRTRMSPEVALRELVTSDPSEAYGRLQKALVADSSYEMLMLAGRIAAWDLHQPIEAVDFLEKAIRTTPLRGDAQVIQFDIFTHELTRAWIDILRKFQLDVALEIDDQVWRDYSDMPKAERTDGRQIAFAQYMLWRGHYDKAEQFSYRHLFDQSGVFYWWKFEWRLIHFEAIARQGRHKEAEQGLHALIGRLRQAFTSSMFEAHDLKSYAARAGALADAIRNGELK